MGGGPSSVRLKHRLDLDAELDLLADQPATGLERLVPREAPLLAVDLRLGGKESALTAERVAHLPVVLGLQRDGLGYSTDGEIAVDLPVVVAVVFHTRARERQLRVRVDLEEVRAAQMIVALLGARGRAPTCPRWGTGRRAKCGTLRPLRLPATWSPPRAGPALLRRPASTACACNYLIRCLPGSGRSHTRSADGTRMACHRVVRGPC